MPRQKRIKLRVKVSPHCCPDSDFPAIIECLRYAGILRVGPIADTPKEYTIEIPPPAGIPDHRAWGERNKARMKTFGFQAEIIEEDG